MFSIGVCHATIKSERKIYILVLHIISICGSLFASYVWLLQERWFQQTDKDFQSWGQIWLLWATGLPLCGGSDPVLPEQIISPVQLQTGHTATLPHIQIPAGELMRPPSMNVCYLILQQQNIFHCGVYMWLAILELVTGIMNKKAVHFKDAFNCLKF